MSSKTAQSLRWQNNSSKQSVMTILQNGSSHLPHQLKPTQSKWMEKPSIGARSVAIGPQLMTPTPIQAATNLHQVHLPTETKSAETNLTAWDPSAWIVETDKDAKCPPISISVMLTYAYIMATVGIYIFGLTITPLDELRSTLTSTFMQAITYLCDYCFYLLSTTAPVLWFLLGYISCYYIHTPFNPVLVLTPINHSIQKAKTSIKHKKKLNLPKTIDWWHRTLFAYKGTMSSTLASICHH